MNKRNLMPLLRRMVVILLALIVLAVLCLLALSGYVKSSARGRILTPEQVAALDADCILVLGSQVTAEGAPRLILEERLQRGIELYELGASDRLLMSGDHGRTAYDEVNVMKRYAMEAGIPSGKIFMDHAGFSTYDSMYRARDIFQANRVIVVSQDYHLYRALYIGEALGLECYGVAADTRPIGGQTRRELREILARGKDFFKCVIRPRPVYLGEAIPVSGDGDLTND